MQSQCFVLLPRSLRNLWLRMASIPLLAVAALLARPGMSAFQPLPAHSAQANLQASNKITSQCSEETPKVNRSPQDMPVDDVCAASASLLVSSGWSKATKPTCSALSTSPSRASVPYNAHDAADDRFPPDPRKRQQYCGNLVLKINAKLGGQHSLIHTNNPSAPKLFPYENQPFMIIGADVTHPMGFNRATPSIASVVGSIDRYATRYAERSRLQGHRVEMIQVGMPLHPLLRIHCWICTLPHWMLSLLQHMWKHPLAANMAPPAGLDHSLSTGTAQHCADA